MQINVFVNSEYIPTVLESDKEIRAAMRQSTGDANSIKLAATQNAVSVVTQAAIEEPAYPKVYRTQSLVAGETTRKDPFGGMINISVIDEDDGGLSFGTLEDRDNLWAEYRELFPNNKFVLLAVDPGGVSTPAGFGNSPYDYRFNVERNFSAPGTNWYNLLVSNGINFNTNKIHLIVDNSGSMTASDVQYDLDQFVSLVSDRLVPTNTWQNMLPYENWILMHKELQVT